MKKTVLLVDDSMTDAFAINDILYGHYQVFHLTHANTILEDVQHLRPDMILMDIVMPGMSGFGATRLLKSDLRTKHIPVIVCSSKAIDADRIWAKRNGADEYITKPAGKKDLLGKVEGVLRNTTVGSLVV